MDFFCFSEGSLIHSLNSGGVRKPKFEQARELTSKAWSLTERVRGANKHLGSGQENRTFCRTFFNYAVLVGGTLLVLVVIILVTVETIRTIFFQDTASNNSSQTDSD